MSQPSPIAAAAPRAASEVHAAITRASAATGVDFQYLLAQARLESGLDPAARAGTSSAAGLYQFTKDTWLQTLERHGADHGFSWADSAIDQGRVNDPQLRGQILALRLDPHASALMAGELASDNAAHLTGVLGRAPDAAELYMAHFLGAGGAGRFLTALDADPAQSAAALLPQAAAANRAIFFDSTGAPRSVAGVMDLMRGKMARAMDVSSASPELPSPVGRGWGWGSNTGAEPPPPDPRPDGEGRRAPPSMAETLRATFNAGDTSAPAQIRRAYAKLRAFNL